LVRNRTDPGLTAVDRDDHPRAGALWGHLPLFRAEPPGPDRL